jgi:hypothetical protein
LADLEAVQVYGSLADHPRWKEQRILTTTALQVAATLASLGQSRGVLELEYDYCCQSLVAQSESLQPSPLPNISI